MKPLENLKYTKEHEWVRVEGEFAYTGITDFAQRNLGSIVFVELPEVGETYEEGDSFSVIDSVKATSDIYMPIAGEVVEVNENLDSTPELINDDAYENWIAKIKLTNPAKVEELMNAEEYEEFCEQEEV